MREITLVQGLKDVSLRKGSYIWISEIDDFGEITTFGSKSPSKREKWLIELKIENKNIVVKDKEILGYCDYNTARIINVLQDEYFKIQKQLKDLQDAKGRRDV